MLVYGLACFLGGVPYIWAFAFAEAVLQQRDGTIGTTSLGGHSGIRDHGGKD